MNYDGFGVVAIKAIQEQQAIIDAHADQLASQAVEMDELRQRLERLEAKFD